MPVSPIEDALGNGVHNWVVVGDAPLLVDRAVDTIVAWGKARCGPPQLNLAVFHATDAHAGLAIQTARTLPMMAAWRVVVLREIDQAEDVVMEPLAAYLADPSPTTLFIACGGGFPKPKKGGANWAQRIPKLLENPKSKLLRRTTADVSPHSVAREHAQSLGKKLGADEARLLVETVGGDLGVVVQEVEKLALYVGDEPVIGRDAVIAACSLVAEAVVWDLTTGLATRKPQMAIGALHRLLEDGDSPHRLLGLVVWQLRQVLQVAEVIAAGRKDFSGTGLRGDQVDRIRRAIGTSPPDAVQMLERVSRANRAMNSHRAGDRRVLEALVVELCG
jgi:DNA polymerase-3 subunit delta